MTEAEINTIELDINDIASSITDMQMVRALALESAYHSPLPEEYKTEVTANIKESIDKLTTEMGGLVGLFALAINEEGQLTVIKTGTVPALSRLAYISTKHVVGLTRELANDIRALSTEIQPEVAEPAE